MIPMPSTGPTSHGSGHDNDDALLPTPTATPVACFITTEAELNAGESSERSPSRLPNSRKGPHEAVRRPPIAPRRRAESAYLGDSWIPSPSNMSCDSSDAGNTNMLREYNQSLTPGLASLSGHESGISSISSRRNSLTGSSLHDSFPPSLVDYSGRGSLSPRQEPSCATPGPQLIMPSLTVPRRRPFSVTGRALGKLKILVTGGPGIGKTSLIQSMAQSCEHIVHIDPVNTADAHGVVEIYASTKPHSWWQSASDSASLRRRSSTGEILSRNICFVESSTPREAGKVHPAVQYIKSQLAPSLGRAIGDADLTSILSSGAEPIVDVILYLLPSTGPTLSDIEHIESLETMANVIPLIGHVDELATGQIHRVKEQFAHTLSEHGIEGFSFADSLYSGELEEVYAISSAAQNDSEVMDASILMNSDYMPPLTTSDLGKLVDRIFSPEGSAQLRHATALKSVKWRQKQGMEADLHLAMCRRQSLNYVVSPVVAANPFEQHPFWRRVEVSNWAQDLRHSLQGEMLGRASVLSVCLQESQDEAKAAETRLSLVNGREKRSKRRKSSKRSEGTCHQDPLGLLELASQVQHSGKLSLELLSSFGALGCLMALIFRPSSAEEVMYLQSWCTAL